MNLEEIREFKKEAACLIYTQMLWEAWGEQARGERKLSLRCPPSLGIHPVSPGKYQLAIRVCSKDDMPEEAFEKILNLAKKAGDEVDFHETGKIHIFNDFPSNHQPNDLQECIRPLIPGISIGQAGSHIVGTLGCFVRKRGTSEPLFLSNSHIIASPKNTIGHSIIQPSKSDGGVDDQHHIATLLEAIHPKERDKNLVDAAIAKIESVSNINPNCINNIELRGCINRIQDLTDAGLKNVLKVGRTTGLTYGEISAFELNVPVTRFDDDGKFIFENQIEIKPTNGSVVFAKPGDSGSVIINDQGIAVGLLFAADNDGRGCANPINLVFEKLNLELV